MSRLIINYTPPPPPPPSPTPFLELPWDYKGQGLVFNNAATALNSWFDHQFPLLSSNFINEPSGVNNTTLGFDNLSFPIPQRWYSSHDGYDWGWDAHVRNGNAVLAAADGCAYYRYTGGKNGDKNGGNEIHIIHSGNGENYQTRYFHLQGKNLLTTETDPQNCINVQQGDEIGLVGSTGNSSGPHIHFMVVENKDRDGDFDDNIPDGVTDPFGWQNDEMDDPWPNFTFIQNGENKTGSDSHYIWIHPIPNLNPTLTSNAAFFEMQKYKLKFLQDSTLKNHKIRLFIYSAPWVVISEKFKSLGNSLEIKTRDLFNDRVESLLKDYTITVDYSDTDISKFKPDTLTIYSSKDGSSWNPEITTLDPVTKTASATLNHFSYYALIGERIDTIPPTTNYQLIGTEGAPPWYLSDVNLTLTPDDGEGLGVAWTLVKINDTDWQTYTGPLNFSADGDYSVQYFSGDNDNNIEEVKTGEFKIDKTPPNVTYQLTGKNGQENVFSADVILTLTATDNEQGSGVDKIFYRQSEGAWQEYSPVLIFTEEGNYAIEFYAQDLAGNRSDTQNISFIIDSEPPEIKLSYDPDIKNLSFSGIDTSPTQVVHKPLGKNTYQVEVTDSANHITTLKYITWSVLDIKSYSFLQITYSDQPIQQLPKNLLNIVHSKGKDQTIDTLSQTWWLKDEVLVNLLYLHKTNTTTIRWKTPEDPLQVKTKPDFFLLWLQTTNGRLNYSY